MCLLLFSTYCMYLSDQNYLNNKYDYFWNIKKVPKMKNIDFYPNNVIIPNDFEWIKSYEEFFSTYKCNMWGIDPHYWKMNNFFIKIKEYVSWDIDPIKYLYYLYYELWFSWNDIHSTIWWILWWYAVWSIEWVMSNSLWWILRDPNSKEAQTILRKDKDHKKVKKVNDIQKYKKLKNVEILENILSRISKNKEKKEFSSEVYKTLKNIRTRAKYLLDINGYISEDIFVENLIKLSDKYGMKVTAEAITNILEKETKKIWNLDKLELRAWRIREIKNEQDL